MYVCINFNSQSLKLPDECGPTIFTNDDELFMKTKITFLTRGYAKRRNGFLLGLRYANVSLAHSSVESS